MSNLQLQYLDLAQEQVIADLTPDGIRFAVDPERGPYHLTEESQTEQVQAKVTADELGAWMHVYGERNAVHLNGRPVHRLACVRAGDRIFVDGQSFFVVDVPQPNVRDESALEVGDSIPTTFSLRGLSAEHFGQSIPVRSEMRVASDAAADLRLNLENGNNYIATLKPLSNGVGFAVDPAHTSQVNGRNVRTGTIEVGDQWVIDGRYRFALESPDFVVIHRPEIEDEELALKRLSEEERQRLLERRKLLSRLGWLVGISALLSALMVALIVYAPR